MRKASLDRSQDDRRLGMRRAAIAAWAVVFALFAFILVMPSFSDSSVNRAPSPGHAIERLVARAVPQDSDACQCTEFDRLEMAPAPSLC
jgi:glycerol uptake facilitator-like aquaporin